MTFEKVTHDRKKENSTHNIFFKVSKVASQKGLRHLKPLTKITEHAFFIIKFTKICHEYMPKNVKSWKPNYIESTFTQKTEFFRIFSH